MLLAALFYLKPKAQNFALFLLLHYFLLYRFTYGQSIGCIVHSWYYLAVMRKLIQDPDMILGRLFQSATGTLMVCLLTITQSLL